MPGLFQSCCISFKSKDESQTVSAARAKEQHVKTLAASKTSREMVRWVLRSLMVGTDFMVFDRFSTEHNSRQRRFAARSSSRCMAAIPRRLGGQNGRLHFQTLRRNAPAAFHLRSVL